MQDMIYRRVGQSGLVASVAGLGCNNFGQRIDKDESAAVLSAALDEGITFLDTADIYGGSEEVLGALLYGMRDKVILATKFGANVHGLHGPDWGARGSRRYIRRSVEDSLRRLRTDWIDLYQIHFPDPATPVAETLETLDDLVRDGKVRYVGCSNFSAAQIIDAAWESRTRGLVGFISAQNEYSLLNRGLESEVAGASDKFGLGIIPFYPLANGLLTGKYARNAAPPAGSRIEAWRMTDLLTPASFDLIEKLSRFARDRQLSVVDVAIGALAAQPGVCSVIAGATTPDQVRQNAKAVSWHPSAEDLAALDVITPSLRPAPAA